MHGKPLFAVSQWSTQSKLKIPNKDTHIGFSRSVSLYLHLLLSPHITCPIFCYLNEHTDMRGIGVFWVLNRFHLRSRSWILFSQASCVMSQKQQLDCGRAKFCWLWLGLTGVCLGEETSWIKVGYFCTVWLNYFMFHHNKLPLPPPCFAETPCIVALVWVDRVASLATTAFLSWSSVAHAALLPYQVRFELEQRTKRKKEKEKMTVDDLYFFVDLCVYSMIIFVSRWWYQVEFL